jgi:hypothetical protein
MRRKEPGDLPMVVPVRLYLEDVRALYDEIANASGGARLETDEWELESPDELVKIRESRLSTLRLRGKDASVVYVNIWPHGAYVGRWGDAAEVVVAAGKLQDILLDCRKKPQWLFSYWSLILWFGLEIVALVLLFGGIDGRTAVIVGAVLWTLAFLGLLQLVSNRSFRGSLVYLRHRRDSPSFFKRNSDALIVNGVVSLASASLSAVITYYLTRK